MAAWFWKGKGEGEDRPKKVNIAEGLWVKCDSCKEIVYRAEVDRAGRVCPKCRYPFRINARERIASIADEASFEERETGLRSKDPLGFKDTKRYTDRVKAARSKTGLEEAVVTGTARIGGHPVVLAVLAKRVASIGVTTRTHVCHSPPGGRRPVQNGSPASWPELQQASDAVALQSISRRKTAPRLS